MHYFTTALFIIATVLFFVTDYLGLAVGILAVLVEIFAWILDYGDRENIKKNNEYLISEKKL